jgi:hypothetical protein
LAPFTQIQPGFSSGPGTITPRNEPVAAVSSAGSSAKTKQVAIASRARSMEGKMQCGMSGFGKIRSLAADHLDIWKSGHLSTNQQISR